MTEEMGGDGYGGCSKDRKAGINHRNKRSDHTSHD